MSHFAVMVIGKNVDEQLAPYHEFECTGEDNQYVQGIDETEKLKDAYNTADCAMIKLADGTLVDYSDDCLCVDGEFTMPEGAQKVRVPIKDTMTFKEYVTDYYEICVIAEDEDPDIEGKQKYGYCVISKDDEVARVIKRTNPNSKWDWYVEGGRWSDLLLLKSGKYADSAKKGDIDIDGMREQAANAAEEEYDNVCRALGEHLGSEVTDLTGAWEPWEVVRKRHGNIDKAREQYNSKVVSIVRANCSRGPLGTVDNLLVSREEYSQVARNQAMMTYAFVRDSKWIARGEMSWFGISNDKMDSSKFAKLVNEMIDELPDDERITIIDCHI